MTRTLTAHAKTLVLFVFVIAFVEFLTGCGAPKLRDDTAPSPSDITIDQARLEFHGCGYDSIIGTVACAPGQTVTAVTEYTGVITMASSGDGCSLREDIAVTPPETEIAVPTHPPGVSCAVTAIFLPTYPNGVSPLPIRALFGEVVFLADNAFPYAGNFALTTFETVNLPFPGSVRGAFTSRQFSNAVTYTGPTLSYQPLTEGTDFLFVKTWDANGVVTQRSYTANYYSPAAIQLTYQLDWQDDGTWLLTLPDSVSVTSVLGKPNFDLKIHLPGNITGYVRSYTAQGRTLVLNFNKGYLEWAH